MPNPRTKIATEMMPVVLALVLAACGGSDGADPTSTTGATTTTTAAAAGETTTAAATPSTPADPVATAGDLPTELKDGTYLVGSEILPGVWAADECDCAWAVVDESGNETLGIGDDAVVPADAHAMRLGICNWTFKG